jgi:hypothetical protein
MSDDEISHILASRERLEYGQTGMQRILSEINAFRAEALGKLNAMIATCDRIIERLKRHRETRHD